jgi:PAS domain S-box-containing protein
MAGLTSWLRAAVRRPDGKALLAAMLALALLLPAWWLAGRWYGDRLLEQERADAAIETSLRANALSSVINRRLARLQGLYAFVQVELSEEDLALLFQKFAAGLYAGTRGIRNLAVAPDSIVRYVYPLAGNESVVGYDPANDPRAEVRLGVQRAIESGEVTLTGPLDLVQACDESGQLGCQGLIARQAVYQADAYWGLVTMVLDMPTMLAEAGVGEQSGDLDFALRDASGRVFYGPEPVFESSPVLSVIRFPDDAWELAAVPPGGWQATAQGPVRVFQVGGLIIVFLVAGLVYLSVNRQARLARAVRERTGEIARVNEQLRHDIAERRRAEAALTEREAQYRSIFESTSDGLLIFDLEGKLVDLNPAAARIHGYSVEEFRLLKPAQFIHEGSLPLFEQFVETVRAGHDYRGRAKDLRRDGAPFHVEVLGTGFIYRGQPHALAVLRDITEEVEDYRFLEQRVEARTREVSMLLDVSANIASTLDLPLLLELILEQLQQVVDYDGASVLILEENELRTVAHRGPIPHEVQAQMQLSREQAGELWEAMEGHEPLIIGDVREDTGLARAFRQAFGEYLEREMAYVRTWVGVPLMIQERLIGWLSLHHSRPWAYAQHQAALAQTIGNQAATAIENARLYGQARRLAALEERQRLARELHDSVSQVLYGVALGARTADALLDRAAIAPELKASLAEPLDYVLSLAEAGLAEMRALIFELRPDSLEREGLVAALTRQAAALRARHKLEVHTEFHEEPTLSFEAKEAFYRIAQEALNNTVRHAQAARVDIRLRAGRGDVVLELVDDGVGFDPQTEYSGHMGLSSMRERAAQIGGVLEIVSGAGRGAVVRLRIPAPNRPAAKTRAPHPHQEQ